MMTDAAEIEDSVARNIKSLVMDWRRYLAGVLINMYTGYSSAYFLIILQRLTEIILYKKISPEPCNIREKMDGTLEILSILLSKFKIGDEVNIKIKVW